MLDLTDLDDDRLEELAGFGLSGVTGDAIAAELARREDVRLGPAFLSKPQREPFKHGERWFAWVKYDDGARERSFAIILEADGRLTYAYDIEKARAGAIRGTALARRFVEVNGRDTLARHGGRDLVAALALAKGGVVY